MVCISKKAFILFVHLVCVRKSFYDHFVSSILFYYYFVNLILFSNSEKKYIVSVL